MFPCLIIVSRDQSDLLNALLALYGQEAGVEIRIDRRAGLPWTGRGDPPAAPRRPSIPISKTTGLS